MKNIIFFLLSSIFLGGCSDNASVNFFDKKIVNKEIECLKLVVFPPDKTLESTLNELYDFSIVCEYRLEVSKKSGITCNSSHNIQKKATGTFPSSYLKMQLNRGNQLLYSYYIDLQNDVSKKDIKRAFTRMNEDLKIK